MIRRLDPPPTDREITLLAAKAAGLKPVDEDDTIVPRNGIWIVGIDGNDAFWDPLNDDAQALRLAIQLKFRIEHGERGKCIFAGPADGTFHEVAICHHKDQFEAGRRAIVLAAAEMILPM